MVRINKPRCPRCHKVQADWVTEAGFTCRYCHTKFEIVDGKVWVEEKMRYKGPTQFGVATYYPLDNNNKK